MNFFCISKITFKHYIMKTNLKSLLINKLWTKTHKIFLLSNSSINHVFYILYLIQDKLYNIRPKIKNINKKEMKWNNEIYDPKNSKWILSINFPSMPNMMA
jgi:hypothetical protein